MILTKPKLFSKIKSVQYHGKIHVSKLPVYSNGLHSVYSVVDPKVRHSNDHYVIL